MTKYPFKTFLSNGREYYEYRFDAELPEMLAVKSVPFPESLVSMAYLDRQRFAPLFEQLDKALACEQENTDSMIRLLGALTEVHIYFAVLWVELQPWLTHGNRTAFAELRGELRQIPEEIMRRQERLQSIFSTILNMDEEEKAPAAKRSRQIAEDERASPIREYEFRPIQTTLERTSRGSYVEVALPATIFDLMDYHLRECLKRNIRMRACRNCGRYFAVTGRVTAEYCTHPVDARGRTCREVASILQWRKKREGDTVFREYRKEYKKRFARMKAGTMEAALFYQWGELAREKKAQCEAGSISHEIFFDWLARS